MRHHLTMQQWVPYPVQDVFNFFSNPMNLPPLMPRWQAARIDSAAIVAPRPPEAARGAAPSYSAGAGSRMLISFRPFPFAPVRMHWDAEIAEFSWDDHFCDVQLSGPFGYWRHCHHIREESRQGRPGASVTDDVTYAFPFGVLGDLAYFAGGGLQVRSLFLYRQRQLLRLLPRTIAPSGA